MSGDSNLTQVARGLAAIRAAEALLRALGGTSIYVRVPASVSNDVVTAGDAPQLGLSAILTEDVELSPVVTRALTKTKDSQRRVEVTVSAAALSRAKDINDATTAEQFFDSALGIIYVDKLWRIESLAVDSFAGAPYLYRFTISE